MVKVTARGRYFWCSREVAARKRCRSRRLDSITQISVNFDAPRTINFGIIHYWLCQSTMGLILMVRLSFMRQNLCSLLSIMFLRIKSLLNTYSKNGFKWGKVIFSHQERSLFYFSSGFLNVSMAGMQLLTKYGHVLIHKPDIHVLYEASQD